MLEGDRSLFLRYDEVEWAWRIIDPVLDNWAQDRGPVPTYPAGGWEPAGVNGLFDTEHQRWRQHLEPQ